MPIQQAKVPSKNFKALIRDVLKFPPSASVAASEIVHFAVNKGRARASVAGLVTSTATALGMRDLDAFTADYRSLRAYAAILPDDGSVDIELSHKDKKVTLVCGEQTLTLALNFGAVLPKPKAPETFFEATEDTAKTLKWLAGVAEKDEAKPDMSCVYLKDGAAMAGNQKCIAIARTAGLPQGQYPLPLQLCSVLEPGDKLAKASGGLVLVSGCAVHEIPYLASSINFPSATVERLDTAKGDAYGRCKASAMADVFGESADCVARIPKSQAYIVMTFGAGKIQIRAQSQTALFRTVMDGKIEKDGDLWLELPEAEEALSAFGGGEVVCRKLQPKGEAVLEGSFAKVFFAAVKMAQPSV